MKIESVRQYEIKFTDLSHYEVLALQRACRTYSEVSVNEEAESMGRIADSLKYIVRG